MSIENVGLIFTAISTLISSVAILLSVWTYLHSLNIRNYEVFDATYNDLLKTGMDYPAFRNPEITQNYRKSLDGDDLARYELYAFMCWNFCETILDRKDKSLMETWEVVVDNEAALHRKWLESPENLTKFKKRFTDYIRNRYPA